MTQDLPSRAKLNYLFPTLVINLVLNEFQVFSLNIKGVSMDKTILHVVVC